MCCIFLNKVIAVFLTSSASKEHCLVSIDNSVRTSKKTSLANSGNTFNLAWETLVQATAFLVCSLTNKMLFSIQD